MLPDDQEFKDQVVIVTGSARGIGRAIAESFHRLGARVAIWDIREQAAIETARAIDPHAGCALGMGVDIRDQTAVDRAVEGVLQRWERVDALINNAGIQWDCPSLELRSEDMLRVLETHLIGAFYCSQAVARSSMVPRQRGAIVSISSIASILGMPRRLSYSMAKAGINAMTRVLAVEWATYNIRVNCIAPGYTRTPLLEAAVRAGRLNLDEIQENMPGRRIAEPSQIADLAVFLASEHSQFMTGQTIVIDGGYTLRGIGVN